MDVDQPADVAKLDWLVTCVNEYCAATRTAAGELSQAYPKLSGGPDEAESLSANDLERVADGWFEVFRAAPDPNAVAAVLNELLDHARPQVTATSDGNSVTAAIMLHHGTDASTRLSVWGALLLLNATDALGVDRLGVCSGTKCVDVYVDRSPLHNRRFCSQQCQTRERVSRFRQRNSRA